MCKCGFLGKSNNISSIVFSDSSFASTPKGIIPQPTQFSTPNENTQSFNWPGYSQWNGALFPYPVQNPHRPPMPPVRHPPGFHPQYYQVLIYSFIWFFRNTLDFDIDTISSLCKSSRRSTSRSSKPMLPSIWLLPSWTNICQFTNAGFLRPVQRTNFKTASQK